MVRRTPLALNYKCAGPKQNTFHDSTHSVTAGIGAIGIGKSVMACAEILRQLLVEGAVAARRP